MIRWISQMSITSLVALAAVVACSSSTTSSPRGDGDASVETDPSKTNGCANFGCSPPPACGQQCTAPCGCCPNYDCVNDAQTEADGSEIGEGGTDAGDG